MNTDSIIQHLYLTQFKCFVDNAQQNDADKRQMEYSNAWETNKEIIQSDNYSSGDLWIFGYGSLMWKIDFPVTGCRLGYICGYLRRFYQQSVDHRGTLKKPGRVVTLINAEPKDRVYGVAYHIADKDKENVLKHLDYREKNGYRRCTSKFYLFSESRNIEKDTIPYINVLFYIAVPENKSWAGHYECNNIKKIAQEIFTSYGPSGSNREYLFNLSYSMKKLFPGVKDDHLLEVEHELQNLIQYKESHLLEKSLKWKINLILNDERKVSCEDKDKDKVNMKEFSNELSPGIQQLIDYCATTKGWKEHFLTQGFDLQENTNTV